MTLCDRQQHVQMPNDSRAGFSGSIYDSIAGSYSIERANNAICGENAHALHMRFGGQAKETCDAAQNSGK